MAKTSSKKQSKSATTTNSGNTTAVSATVTTIATPATSLNSTTPEMTAAHRAFRDFMKSAELETIKKFLITAVSIPESENLKTLWDRAFEEGYTIGRQALLGNFNQKLRESYERGFEDGEAAGFEDGRTHECKDWAAEGHGRHCFKPTLVFEDSGTQTDPPKAISTSVYTQTTSQTIHTSSSLLPASATSPPSLLAQPSSQLPTSTTAVTNSTHTAPNRLEIPQKLRHSLPNQCRTPQNVDMTSRTRNATSQSPMLSGSGKKHENRP
jgi:hypothetical protein